MQKLTLSGPVGGDQFNVRQVSDLPPGDIHLIIESPGGCLVTGLAIYHVLKEHDGAVTVEIIHAGSAAVLPALAGQRRIIHGNGHFFIHRTWGTTIGTVNTLRAALKTQNEWDSVIANLYSENTGLPLAQIFRLMDSETTLPAERSVQLGFAHEIIGPVQQAEHAPNLDKTALSCLHIEKEMQGPVMTQFRKAAEPMAIHDTTVKAIMDQPPPMPDIPPGKEAKALGAFVENERREQEIRKAVETRLRRTIRQGGHMTWPAAMSWTCFNCGEINYRPPAQSRLATPCAKCAQTSKKES